MGDCLPKLNEKGIDLLRKTVQEADFVPGTPVFGDETIPSVWYKKDLGKLYIINFTDDNNNYSVNAKELGLSAGIYVDVFTGKEYDIGEEFVVSLKRHDSLCLKRK